MNHGSKSEVPPRQVLQNIGENLVTWVTGVLRQGAKGIIHRRKTEKLEIIKINYYRSLKERHEKKHILGEHI